MQNMSPVFLFLSKMNLILLCFVGIVSGSLLTDFQQIDSNVLDNANVYFINKLHPDQALEFAVLIDSEFESVRLMTNFLEDWISKQNTTTQFFFYQWIQDVKRQSEISKNIFFSKINEIDPVVANTFGKALVSLIYNLNFMGDPGISKVLKFSWG